MNENQNQTIQNTNQIQNNEKQKELKKMKEVISVEAGQKSEIIKENKKAQN